MSHEAFKEMIQKKSYFILKKGKLYKFVVSKYLKCDNDI